MDVSLRNPCKLKLNSDSRNNQSKCLFNDNGYCKYEDKCRNKHSLNICKIKNCNKNCEERHPKQCKYKMKCKFLEKEICAFSHVILVNDDQNVTKLNKESENKIKQIEVTINNMKVENECKIEQLCELVRETRKEFSDRFENEVKKENKNAEKKLENLFEEQIKFIKYMCEDQCREIAQLKEENERLRSL